MDVTAHRFLEGFTTEARKLLVEAMIREDYPDGAYLFHKGDAADGVYLILEGNVEIVRAAGSQTKVIYSIPAGDYFGEVAVLDGLGRSTAARARGATSIAKIPGPILLDTLAAGSGALTLKLLKHVLADLRRATDQIVNEVVNKEKLSVVGEMASSLMHDLRSPVSHIRLSADLIETTNQVEKIPQWCEGVRLQCDRLVGMAAELMEFSKGESKLGPSLTTTTEFLEQFKTINQECLTPNGVEIRFHAEPAGIEIDALRLQRALQNLMTNAVEALHATPNPRIDVEAWVKDSIFYLTVKDNGPGIPTQIQGSLFEPFVTHGKTKGIGLGMAIVRNIVTSHGGTITFKTGPKKGTAFLISIPQKATSG